MSVRVNLLPEEASQRQAAARQRVGIATGGLVVVAALGAVTLWQNGSIDDAESRLADEQTVLAALQSEERQLAEFADLEGRVAQSDGMIIQAMASEASYAGILQDVASVVPSDTELDGITIAMHAADPTATDESTVEVGPATIGTLVLTGRTSNAHAPGVERFLLELDKVAAFHDLFVANSTLEDPAFPYSTFSVEAQLGPEALTGRYLEGVPEGLR